MFNLFRRKNESTSSGTLSTDVPRPPLGVDPVRWYWEEYVNLRDGTGFRQVSQTGMNALALMVGSILDNLTLRCAAYYDTPHKPSTYLLRGDNTGDIEVKEWKNGITFEYRGQVCVCVYPDKPCGQVCRADCPQIKDCLEGTRQ